MCNTVSVVSQASAHSRVSQVPMHQILRGQCSSSSTSIYNLCPMQADTWRYMYNMFTHPYAWVPAHLGH
jgi:hypothetical protein